MEKAPNQPSAQGGSIFRKLQSVILGKPRDLSDSSIFHRIALIPLLAWIGLGADGLSSSSYGPEESFRALADHKFLALGLGVAVALTIFIISAAYRRIIEEFPHGGGGYTVASKLLGHRAGVVSGCALLIDYILTITISIAAAGDAIFSFLPMEWHTWKMLTEISLIGGLIVINIRGVRESILVLAPVFVMFVITHVIAILFGVCKPFIDSSTVMATMSTGVHAEAHSLQPFALFLIFIYAYSLGGGTYTGLEAVSNGLPIMREPKVETAKRTMTYMAASLAFTASGLLICYLLWNIAPVEGKTLNAVLMEKMAGHFPYGGTFVIITLLSEGLLLVVGAQTGYIDGPRVLANMAVDSYVPRRFAALSDRLTTSNGIILMGISSLIALLYTQGKVSHLVVMYSINVFLTFSLSIYGMLHSHLTTHRKRSQWKRSMVVFTAGFLLCLTILIITVIEKFQQGGWITLTVTCAAVVLCFQIKKHYRGVAKKIDQSYSKFEKIPELANPNPTQKVVDPSLETAVVMVGMYSGLGVHTVKTILKMFPGVYKNFLFVSIGSVDSGVFKGEGAIDELRKETEKTLQKYVHLGRCLGIPSGQRLAIGTDVVQEGTTLCTAIAKEFPHATFFTGKVVFAQEGLFHRLLHNETGFSLQKRLLLDGLTMVVLPATLV